MKKALLTRRKIVTKIVTITMVVLITLILNGCAVYEMYEFLEEEERLEEEQKEKEGKKTNLSNKLEKLYNNYTLLDESENLVKDFNNFLETNFENPEHILKGLRCQQIYNRNIYNQYTEEREKLEENKAQFTTKEFETKTEQLWNRYQKNKNIIQEYLTEQENQILKNCEEEINEMYIKYL